MQSTPADAVTSRPYPWAELSSGPTSLRALHSDRVGSACQVFSEPRSHSDVHQGPVWRSLDRQ
jgi:hypothetical protein